MSSSNVALSVRGLSKSYTIAHNAAKHTTAGEAIMHRLRNPFQKVERETFWALKNVEFDIQKGDVVGVIGRNGAGKSTLLKILSRITEPTTGEINLYGRVGSLLEVGTGFSAELTGRENIYLNGAILGMTRREITRQFDAIVDFAGVEQFLDTPVKRYSSGMYVRLAFAVAAHLNPEILIVDEVLAVGDSEFQKKCLGKMRDVATSGRTVLLVSHNMQSISVLCNKAMVLQRGVLVHEGDVDTAVERYLDLSLVEDEDAPALAMRRPGSGEYRFTSMKPQKDTYGGGDEKIIEFRIERQKHQLGRMYVSANIANEMGMVIAQLDSRLDDFWLDDADTIEGLLKIRTPWLKPGTYTIEAYICAGGIVDKYERACTFQVSPLLPYTKGTVSDDGVALGVVFSEFSWHQVQGTTVMTASR